MTYHRLWCEAGQASEAFWQQTPRIIASVVRAYQDRLDKQNKMGLSHAWHGGVIAKASKTPPLSQILGTKPKAQTREQMLSMMKAWVAATQHLGTESRQ